MGIWLGPHLSFHGIPQPFKQFTQLYSDDNQLFGAERPFALTAVQMRSGAPKKDAQASEV